jgi:hypothetical protein
MVKGQDYAGAADSPGFRHSRLDQPPMPQVHSVKSTQRNDWLS